jgi:predicted short-subunit dehydrogenase-like oxidoreductase (DUF2520 family)
VRLIVAGTGRAGGALGLAALAVGHEVVGIVPGPSGRVPVGLAQVPIVDRRLDADLLVIAVRDDAIDSVARALAGRISAIGGAIHLSGFTSVDALDSFADLGVPIGSFHPLQTLPTPEVGAASLAGAFAAITSRDQAFVEVLTGLANGLGMRPFLLDDALKPAYHAAASAASNFVVAALGVGDRLARRAGVPFEVFRPLVDAIVDNAFRFGPETVLTGPVARGDARTVAGQIREADAAGVGDEFRAMVEATAAAAGTGDLFATMVRR